MDKIRAIQLLSNASYRYAKTMPENPHFYTLRKDWHDDTFCDVVMYIRKNGYPYIFNKRKYICFDANGYAYWTMGAPINKTDGSPNTILINRRDKFATGTAMIHEYDSVIDWYDTKFEAGEYIEENTAIFNMLNLCDGSVLDIGCGTGLLYRMGGISVDCYTGIDPSNESLIAFVQKHPEIKGRLLNEKLESYYDDKHQNIVSIFGGVSYVTGDGIENLLAMIGTAKRVFLMFFKPEYYPVTHNMLSIIPKVYPVQKNRYIEAGCKISEYGGKYLIVQK